MRDSRRIGSTSGGTTGRRRGGVLALVVVAVLAVATLSAGLLQVSSAMTKRQVSNTNIKLAFYMAESGLAEAYQGLSIGKTGNVGTQAAPARFGNGLFWVEATDNPDGTVTLDSTGMVANAEAELSLVVEPRLSSVAALGVFADVRLDIGPGMVSDGYDSGASAYEQSVLTAKLSSPGGVLPGVGGGSAYAPPPLGKTGSNGPILVTGTGPTPTVIDGDLTPGPGQAVTAAGHVTIHGSTVAADATVSLPPVSVPSFPPSSGIIHSGPVPYLVLPGQYQLPQLEAATGAEIIVQGPSTLVLDRLQLASGAALHFDTTGGSVSLFVNDVLELQAGSVVSSSGENAWEVTIQVPGALASPALLAATSDFHGVVYAPQATVEVHSSFEFSGSLVGRELDFVGPVQLHFDQYLEEIAEELALPRLVSWRIVKFSNPNGLSKVMDPFLFLGVDRTLCPLPAEAHEDQTIEVTFEALGSGLTSRYAGLESAFDWSLVGKVYSITRDGLQIDPDGGGVAEFSATLLELP